jgi:hypothetical protein
VSFASGTGYPDFTRLSTTIADPLVKQVLTPIPATSPSFGPFFVGGFASLYVSAAIQLTVSEFGLTFAWYADETLVYVIGETGYITFNEIPIIDAFSNIGPWLTVTLNNFTSTAGGTYSLGVTALNVDASQVPTLRGNYFGGPGPVSVPANSSTTVFNNFITTGPALVSGYPPGAVNWQITYQFSYSPGIYVNLIAVQNTSQNPFASFQVVVPGVPCAVELINGDNVARNFQYLWMTSA